VVTGDTSQVDLPRGTVSGLADARQVLARVKGVAFVDFSSADVVRHPLVARIVDAYDQARPAPGTPSPPPAAGRAEPPPGARTEPAWRGRDTAAGRGAREADWPVRGPRDDDDFDSLGYRDAAGRP
jgi:hypothetical protein